MTRPLPCPFCGKAPKVQDERRVLGVVFVECRNMRCPVVVECEGGTEAAAIRRWNRRVPKEAKNATRG